MKLSKIFLCSFMAFMFALFSMQKKSAANKSYDDVMSIIHRYSKDVNKKYGIELKGYGLHCAGKDKIYDGKIHEIDLMYCLEKRMNFEDARKLFYVVVDNLLEELNRQENIKSYFFRTPITYNDLHFSLGFDYEQKGYLKKDNMYMVAILDNKIKYFILEKDAVNAGLEMKQITPEVFIATGISSDIRCITKPLPEMDSN